jgi:hypothetical protein
VTTLRLALAALALAGAIPAVAQSRGDSTRVQAPPPVPTPGQIIRVSAPSLPAPDNQLTGAFAGVDSLAETRTLALTTRGGTRFVPCTVVQSVELRHERRVPLWQKVGWTLAGAYAGLYIGHAIAGSPPGSITAEDPPLPHPEQVRAANRRSNRIMIGGALLGGGVAWLAIRDTGKWRSAVLPSCIRY